MPPSTHDVIALISGGKDSFLALLHCLAQNHHVVALANLHPPTQSPSPPTDPTTKSATDTAPDANSYMYQTVGHTLIPLYARALSIPLYRGEILGAAVNSQRDYHPNSLSWLQNSDPAHPQQDEAEPADETESLIPLLRRIQRAHPSATALVSGAILSTYQRTRIESVALRLGLVPLAPLWQYPFLPTPVPRSAGLLEDVAAVGLEARIVKVASGGLDKGFLWGDLRDAAVRRRVASGVGRFGGSVLGEGGEFETLVLDGPEEVFKGRIELEEAERHVRRGDGGEAYLAFTGGRVVEKEEKKKKPVAADNSSGEEEWRRRLRVPGLWDERFKALADRIKEPILHQRACSFPSAAGDPNHEHRPLSPTEQRAPPPNNKPIFIPHPHTTSTRSTLTISNLTSPSPSPPSPSSSSAAAAIQQTHSITTHLLTMLATSTPPLSPSDILFTTLLLRDMAHFPAVNTAYATLFTTTTPPFAPHHQQLQLQPGIGGPPIPPARATVACGDLLPPGVEVVMRVVVARRPPTKRQKEAAGAGFKDGLHVQSTSLWAPANIGPYSQAVALPVSSSWWREEEGDGGEDGEGTPGVVYVAGQIPLVPASMEMYAEGGFGEQTCLALQHLWRVGIAMRVQYWMSAIAFLAPGAALAPAGQRAEIAWRAWKHVHEYGGEEEEEEEEVDVWDQRYGVQGKKWGGGGEKQICLPDFGVLRGREGMEGGFFAVEVDALPRGAAVEWQALGVRDVSRIEASSEAGAGGLGERRRICRAHGVGRVIHIPIPLAFEGRSVEEELQAVREGEGDEGEGMRMTVYTSREFGRGDADAEGWWGEATKAQIVPCRAVWGPGGRRLGAAVVVECGM